MKTYVFICLGLALSGFFLSGCGPQLAHSYVNSKRYTYDEVKSSIPKLNPKYGRVIIYYKHEGVDPIMAVSIKIDDYSCGIYNETFQYDDLTEGSHTVIIEHTKNSSSNTKKSAILQVTIRPGETLYLEIHSTSNPAKEFFIGPDLNVLNVQVVNEQSALKILPHLVYAYNKPVSCLAQQLQRYISQW